MQTRFIITPDGELTQACIDRHTTLDDDATAKCLLQSFEGIRFEPSTGHTTVVYPIMFSPG